MLLFRSDSSSPWYFPCIYRSFPAYTLPLYTIGHDHGLICKFVSECLLSQEKIIHRAGKCLLCSNFLVSSVIVCRSVSTVPLAAMGTSRRVHLVLLVNALTLRLTYYILMYPSFPGCMPELIAVLPCIANPHMECPACILGKEQPYRVELVSLQRGSVLQVRGQLVMLHGSIILIVNRHHNRNAAFSVPG